jgi:uncharacterized protein YkwD
MGRRVNLQPDYSRRRACACLALAGALLIGTVAHAQPSVSEEAEARVLALVNGARAERGVPPLEREPRLDATARYFVDFMAASGRLDHLADGTTPAARVMQRGYEYCVITENIGFEYSSRGFVAERLAQNLVAGWLDSPTHRENILDTSVTQTGLAVGRSAKNEYYAVQIFGRPALVKPASKAKPGAKSARRC